MIFLQKAFSLVLLFDIILSIIINIIYWDYLLLNYMENYIAEL